MIKVNHTDKEKFNIGDINVDDMESINEKRRVKKKYMGHTPYNKWTFLERIKKCLLCLNHYYVLNIVKK